MKTQLSRNRWPYSDQSPGSFVLERWALVLASLIFAAWCGVVSYKVLDVRQLYPEPIVGAVAWALANKFHDYAALFAIVGGFLAFFMALSWLSARLTRQVGFGAEERFHDLLAMLSAPAGVWFACLLTTKETNLLNLGIAGLLVVTAALFALLLQCRSKAFWKQDIDRYFRVLSKAVLVLVVIGFAVAAVGLLVSRAGMLFPLPEVHANRVYRVAIVALVLGGILVGVLMATSRSAALLEARLDTVILGVQLAYPAFFFMLLPAPWRIGGGLAQAYPISAWGYAFVGICMAVNLAAVIGCWRSARRAQATPAGSNVFGLIALPSMVGVLLFLKTFPVGVPAVNPDDYHFGEMVVPWWSWTQQHLIPFWDYSPARGMMNYIPGALASLVFDGTATTFDAGAPFIYVMVLAIAMPMLAVTIGRGPAMLALFLAPYINWIAEIDIVVTAFVCLAGSGFLRWAPVRWLVVSYCAALALLLYAPGQGALAIVAVSPLAFIMLHRAFNGDRHNLGRALLVLGAITALLGAFTPFGKMLVGAIRYGLEQSSVNSVAHGVAWNATFANADTNPWLFELARCSWLIVAMLAGLLLFHQSVNRSPEGRQRALAFALPIFVLTVVFIIRAAGRIDASAATRLGIASIWALSLLLPILLFVVMRPKAKGAAVLFWVSTTGLILPYFGGIANHYVHAFEPRNGPPALPGYIEGKAVGMPELGNGVAEPGHANRLIQIRRVLDAVLAPQETYLDLTGRHGTYFYFNRRPPIETGSAYNLVTEEQQLRAATSFRRNNPPVVLISADNILHDGGPASLRAHLMYRYLMLDSHYVVVKTGNLVWLMRPDRVARLPKSDAATVTDMPTAARGILNDLFRTPNMLWIPGSWGRSADSLERRMREVRALDQGAQAQLNDVVAEGSRLYRVTGTDPFVSFNVSAWQLAGRDAGILSFDFRCEEQRAPAVLQVYWAADGSPESEATAVTFNGRDGRLMVPLDSVPSWLLAKRVERIRFDLATQQACRSFGINHVRLLQRKAIEQLGR